MCGNIAWSQVNADPYMEGIYTRVHVTMATCYMYTNLGTILFNII